MKVTVVSIPNGTPGAAPKYLESGLEELEIRRRIQTVQTTEVLRSARILRLVMET